MARNSAADHSFLYGALVAVTAVTIGAGSAVAGSLVSRIFDEDDIVRPSTREEYIDTSVQRDSDEEMRVQERRIERLQRMQEAHESAPDEEESDTEELAYRQAYRACKKEGFTRSRLAVCIDSYMQNGSFEYFGR